MCLAYSQYSIFYGNFVFLCNFHFRCFCNEICLLWFVLSVLVEIVFDVLNYLLTRQTTEMEVFPSNQVDTVNLTAYKPNLVYLWLFEWNVIWLTVAGVLYYVSVFMWWKNSIYSHFVVARRTQNVDSCSKWLKKTHSSFILNPIKIIYFHRPRTWFRL